MEEEPSKQGYGSALQHTAKLKLLKCPEGWGAPRHLEGNLERPGKEGGRSTTLICYVQDSN
ncbi:hypothetical protein [Olivibacter sitiensis]|uniref:hypothetical protein n=1 Tax=Olivibacter sitiensis TaxID=376470 RepID=UPI0003FA52FB|nr:hypothetical protein [Olivibacter sitiensis]